MVNSQINKEIQKARLAYGYSLIEEANKDFYAWTQRRSNEHNINRGKGFSRKTVNYSCEFCGKVFTELDSYRTPVYIRFRNHRWRCERKDWEEEQRNFHNSNDENFLGK